MTPSVADFIPTVEGQRGKRYVLGAEARFTDPSPPAFDCSELVQWGLARIGVPFPDGAANQLAYCRGAGTLITDVTDGIATLGALLFRVGVTPVNHVAVSLGDGQTFEARGAAWGVNTFPARGRRWTHAARIPGLDYTLRSVPMALTPTQDEMLRQIHAAVARIEAALGIDGSKLGPDNPTLAQRIATLLGRR